jgi:hypothetical protein
MRAMAAPNARGHDATCADAANAPPGCHNKSYRRGSVYALWRGLCVDVRFERDAGRTVGTWMRQSPDVASVGDDPMHTCMASILTSSAAPAWMPAWGVRACRCGARAVAEGGGAGAMMRGCKKALLRPSCTTPSKRELIAPPKEQTSLEHAPQTFFQERVLRTNTRQQETTDVRRKHAKPKCWAEIAHPMLGAQMRLKDTCNTARDRTGGM